MKANKVNGIELATKKQTMGEIAVTAYDLRGAKFGFEVNPEVEYILKSLRLYLRGEGKGFLLYVLNQDESPPESDYIIECEESFSIPEFGIETYIT